MKIPEMNLLMKLFGLIFISTTFFTIGNILKTDHNSHIKGELRFNINRASISAQLAYKYIHREKATNILTFYLDNNLTIHDVRGNGINNVIIEPASVNHLWQEIIIELKDTLQTHHRTLIQFDYEGLLKTENTSFTYPKITEQWIELPGNIAWIPLYKTFKNPLTYYLHLKMEDNFKLVCNGETKNHKNGNYSLINRHPVFSVTLWGAKTFFNYESDQITIYSYDENKYYTDLLDLCSGGITFLKSRLGEPERLKEAKVLIADRLISGYSLNNMIALHKIDTTKKESLVAFIVHELSHAWWREADYFSHEHWLNESFAEYTGLLYSREKFGYDYFLKRIEEKKKRSEALPAIIEVDFHHDKFHDVIYDKGCVVLHEWEKLIGEQAFITLLKDRVVLNLNTTESLMDYVSSNYSENIKSRFESLLKR